MNLYMYNLSKTGKELIESYIKTIDYETFEEDGKPLIYTDDFIYVNDSILSDHSTFSHMTEWNNERRLLISKQKTNDDAIEKVIKDIEEKKSIKKKTSSKGFLFPIIGICIVVGCLKWMNH